MRSVQVTERRALAAVAVQFFVNGAVVSSYLPRLPEIRDRIGTTVAVLGAILTAASAGGLISSVFSSRVIERYGTKRVLVYGATFNACMLPLLGYSRSVPAVLAVLVLIAGTDVSVDIAMNLQGSWLSARRKVSVMSRLHGLWSVGTLFGGFAASRFAAAGVALEHQLFGAAIVLLVMLVYVQRGLLPDDHPVVTAAHQVPAASAEPDDAVGRRSTSRVLLIAVGASALFAAVLEGTSFDWSSFRLADDFGASPGRAGLAFVVFVLGMTVGRLGGDSVQALVGARNLTRLSIVVTGLGLGAATLVDSQAAVFIGYGVAGFGQATLMPYLYDAAAKLPGKRGAGLGALTGGIRLATLSTPIATGALASTSLSVGSAVAIIALPAVVGFALTTATVTRAGH